MHEIETKVLEVDPKDITSKIESIGGKKIQDVLSIVLYGSVAKGEDDEKSDIDILIVSRKKSRIQGLASADRLSRELNVMLYSYQEWKTAAEHNKVFYKNVMLDCIPLYGDKPVVT